MKTLGKISLNLKKSYEGFTLFSPMATTTTFLIDNEGNLKKQWNAENNVFNTKFITEGPRKGQLFRSLRVSAPQSVTFGGANGLFEIRGWNNELIWQYTHNGNYDISDSFGTISRDATLHHDYAYNPENDSIFFMIWVAYTKDESINTLGRDASLINESGKNDGGLVLESIIEIEIGDVGSKEENKTPLWSWHLSDHLTTNQSNIEKIWINYYDGGDKEDIFHANALDFNIERSELMLNVRGYHEFLVIKYNPEEDDNGKIVYRWGNPTTYKSEYQVNTPTEWRILDGQHNSHWIRAGEKKGQIMTFDNDQYSQKESEVRVIIPIYNDDGTYKKNSDGVYLPTVPEFSVKLPSKIGSWFISGAQDTGSGTILACNGPYGTFTEYDLAKNLVWKYVSPFVGGPNIADQGTVPTFRSNMVFRALKYSVFESIFQRDNFLDLGKLIDYKTFPNTIGDYITKNHPKLEKIIKYGNNYDTLVNPNANCLKIPDLTNNVVNNTIDFILKAKYGDYTFSYPLSEFNGNNELPYFKKISNQLIESNKLSLSLDNETQHLNGNSYITSDVITTDELQTGTIYINKSKVSDDYWLIAPKGGTRCFLLDNNDTLLESWDGHDLTYNGEFDNRWGQSMVSYIWDKTKNYIIKSLTKKVEGININVPWIQNYSDFLGGKISNLVICDNTGSVLWSYSPPEFYDNTEEFQLFIHHDFSIGEINGEQVVFALMGKKINKETFYALGGNRNLWGTRLNNTGLIVPYIRLLKPNLTDGSTQVLWECDFFDYMFQNYNPNLPTYKQNVKATDYYLNFHPYSLGTEAAEGDYHHANAIQFNKNRNELVVSMRGTSEIVVIDYLTKKIKWRYCGAPKVQKNNPKFLGLHDIQWIDYGDEQDVFLLYNNGWGRKGDRIQASIMIIKAIYNNEYLHNKAELLLEIPIPDNTLDFKQNNGKRLCDLQGGVRQTTNGNFVITYSVIGRIIEITPTGEIVKDFINPFSGITNSIKTNLNDMNANELNIFKISLVPKSQVSDMVFTKNIDVLTAQQKQPTNNSGGY